jgi:hypothetical protein
MYCLLPEQTVTTLLRMMLSQHRRWVYGIRFGYTVDVKIMKMEGKNLDFIRLQINKLS